MKRASLLLLLVLAVFLIACSSNSGEGPVNARQDAISRVNILEAEKDGDWDLTLRLFELRGLTKEMIEEASLFSHIAEIHFFDIQDKPALEISILAIACGETFAIPTPERFLLTALPEGFDHIGSYDILLYPEQKSIVSGPFYEDDFFSVFYLPAGVTAPDCGNMPTPSGEEPLLAKTKLVTFLPEWSHSYVVAADSSRTDGSFAVQDFIGTTSGAIVIAYFDGVPYIVGMLTQFIDNTDNWRFVIGIDQILMHLQ